MEKSDVLRNQIAKLVASLPETDKTCFVRQLLVPLKAELEALVSEEGFSALLSHSIYLTAQHHSCFALSWPEVSSAAHLAHLTEILEHLNVVEAREANTALILTFVDFLISMIGEFLTIDILFSAWGKDALGTLGEESQQ
jgi:hypothetical protein